MTGRKVALVINARHKSPTEVLSARDRPNARGDATRQLILLKAEQLFAERGIAAVPLRDIGIAAGQKNNVAVQYHFGDRENLLRELISYRAEESEEVRADLLADLLGNGRPPHVVDLVRTFILSLAGHLEEGNHYLAFLSHLIIERGGYPDLGTTIVGSNVLTLTTILRRVLPDRPEALLQERWTIMMTSAVHNLARYQTALQTGRLVLPLEELIDDLIGFLTAGIEANPKPFEAVSGTTGTNQPRLSK